MFSLTMSSFQRKQRCQDSVVLALSQSLSTASLCFGPILLMIPSMIQLWKVASVGHISHCPFSTVIFHDNLRVKFQVRNVTGTEISFLFLCV
jgi:hypothetical protein